MAEYNESQVSSNETERIAAEQERINNESQRQTNETERDAREATRQSNESTRISRFSEIEAMVAEVEQDIADMNARIDDTEAVIDAFEDGIVEAINIADNKADKSEIPTKTSELTNDSGFLTAIPSEYVTENELNAKGYLTEHQDISNKADKSEIPTKTSQLTNDSNFLTSVPSEYVTDSELNAKGYLTEHQDLSDYAKTADIPSVEGLATEEYVANYVDIESNGFTLGIHEDGLLYIFKDGSPKGVGIEMLSQEVIAGDVIGFIDDDNNIVLSGALAEGVYTLKYEMDDGTIVNVGEISNVTSPLFINQIPLSINSDGTPFNGGQGWKTGYRISKSSGGETALADYECTGFIPVTKDSKIRIKGIDITTTDENAVVSGYDKNFTKLDTGNGVTLGAMIESTDDNGVSTFKGFGAFTHFSSTELAYIRLSSAHIDEDSILTVNEAIV